MTAKKIQSITLKNFKAFYGEQTIDFDGKNVLIYGENGSGKSSLARALELTLGDNSKISRDHKNIFAKRDNFVKVKLSKEDDEREALEINGYGDFLDYKKLSDIHYEGSVRLRLNTIFDDTQKSHLICRMLKILSFDVKEDYEQKLNNLKELREIEYKGSDNTLSTFLEFLNNEEKISNFICKVNKILKKFSDDPNSIKFSHIDFNIIKIDGAVKELGTKLISFTYEMSYQGIILKSDKCSLHLNEAKLSAISLSIYFVLLQIETEQNAASEALKILILDDALTGLDMSNRESILKILKDSFSDYQIFFFTHNRAFYEYIKKHHFNPKDAKWKALEVYSHKDKAITAIQKPAIYDGKNHFERAQHHFDNHDYFAAANYLRKAVEESVSDKLSGAKNYSLMLHDDTQHVPLKTKLAQLFGCYKKLNEDFYCSPSEVQRYEKLNKKIDSLRDRIFNPSSHHGFESPLFRLELDEAFKIVESFFELPEITQQEAFLLQYPELSRKCGIRDITTDTDHILSILNCTFETTPPYNATFSLNKVTFHFIRDYDNENNFQFKIGTSLEVVLTNYTGLKNPPCVREYIFPNDSRVMKKHILNCYAYEIPEDWWLSLVGEKTMTVQKFIEQHLSSCIKLNCEITLLKRNEELQYLDTKGKLLEDLKLKMYISPKSEQRGDVYVFEIKNDIDEPSIITEDKTKKLSTFTSDWKKEFKTSSGDSIEYLITKKTKP